MPDPGRTFATDLGRKENPTVKKRVKPDYPLEVAALGIEGVVEVGLEVDPQGNPRKLRVINSDHALLNKAALDAVAKWTFDPIRLGSLVLASDYTTQVKFSLSRREQREALARLPQKSPLRVFYQVPPEYPLAAEKLTLDGEVVVEFTVTEAGVVRDPRVVKSSHTVFNGAALAAIRQWAFIPARANGQMKATKTQVPFVFKQPSHKQFLARLQSEVDNPLAAPRTALKAERIFSEGSGVVYPFSALMENKHGVVEGELKPSAGGEISVIEWRGDAPEDFRRAVEAMLDASPVAGVFREGFVGERPSILRLAFNPYDGDVRISDAAAAILKQLRLEGDAADFANANELDGKLEPVVQPQPEFPTRLSTGVAAGEAEVEYFVDGTGRAQLPRMVSASDPAFGYAACQAVAGWQFKPPLKDGKPVVVRVRAPFEFKRN